MAVSKEEYHNKLQRELARAGVSRDEAVRNTNIACGYGNSTALQHDVPDELQDKPEPKDE